MPTKEVIKPTSHVQTCTLGDRSLQVEALTASAGWELSSWLFSPEDVTPIEWWRTMPADHLGDTQRLTLSETLDKVSLMQDRQWLSATRGDAAASVALAIEAMPINSITLEIDLAMTALMFCALDNNAAAAMVLAHILHRTRLDHPFARELAVSWLALNLRRALSVKNNPIRARFNSKSVDLPSAEVGLRNSVVEA